MPTAIQNCRFEVTCALSGFTLTENSRHCPECGNQELLTKPIALGQAVTLVDRDAFATMTIKNFDLADSCKSG